MIKLNFTILLLFPIFIFGQNSIFVTYKVNKKVEDSIFTNYYTLEISPNKSSYFYEKNMESKDSLGIFSERIIEKNYKSNIITHYEKIQGNYFCFDEKTDLSFEMTNCQKENLKCAKLKTKNDLWNIEFSTDYPFSDGPYKFYGLPGLIFNISNSNDTFTIKLIEIKEKKVTIDLKKILSSAKKTNKKKFLKAKAVESSNKFLLDDFSNLGVSKSDINIIENMLKASSSSDLFNDFD
ncbi:GLPGLI family protein [Weeksellaceae bacterium A-14]